MIQFLLESKASVATRVCWNDFLLIEKENELYLPQVNLQRNSTIRIIMAYNKESKEWMKETKQNATNVTQQTDCDRSQRSVC